MTSRLLTVGSLVLLSLALAACREDMQDQPRFKPMRPAGLRGDEAPPRTPVMHTISRDDTGSIYFNTGYNGDQVGNYIPFAVNRAVLERGRERFDIYCAPCHGRTGDGNGMVVQRGYTRPPSYHTDRLRNAPLGHFFDVITNGFGAMPDYAAQVRPRDRWAISAYIRALQLSQYAPVSMLPAGMNLPSPPPAIPGTPGSGATTAETEPQSGNIQAAEAPASNIQKNAAEKKHEREQKEKEGRH
ncbi:MAG TPA: cytochrome c [Terriglobales bacterium]|jgi:cytochrome c553|nr:cytochrome c [Terriglobales bacterium]